MYVKKLYIFEWEANLSCRICNDSWINQKFNAVLIGFANFTLTELIDRYKYFRLI